MEHLFDAVDKNCATVCYIPGPSFQADNENKDRRCFDSNQGPKSSEDSKHMDSGTSDSSLGCCNCAPTDGQTLAGPERHQYSKWSELKLRKAAARKSGDS